MMDWYRRKTWTSADEEAFFTKLKRARNSSRAQYLKIQAIELVETKKMELLDVAKGLLNKVLLEYPEDRLEQSPALNTLGDIYKLRGNYERALDYYKQSLDFEKVFSNVITTSYLDFSELIVKTARSDFYDVVEALLINRLSRELFLVAKYKMSAILSVISYQRGDIDKAKYYHDIAEQNANTQTSDLRYHQYLGLVKGRDAWLEKLMNPK